MSEARPYGLGKRESSAPWLKIFCAFAALVIQVSPVLGNDGQSSNTVPAKPQSCFLLWELGIGEIRRNPNESCRTRLSPASTFKIPHALAALDAGVISGIDEKIAYDGREWSRESWRRDHTLDSAMHHSVLWYFQALAERLGAIRESEYLRRLEYGNKDSSSALTTFWLGQSLQITPEEQQAFLIRLYANKLPIKHSAVNDVKAILVQPPGVVINAAGEHPFNSPWAANVVVSAKTGSANESSGRGVRWLVGHVQREDRAFVFVSCVVGTRELAASSAIDLAAQSLREESLL